MRTSITGAIAASASAHRDARPMAFVRRQATLGALAAVAVAVPLARVPAAADSVVMPRLAVTGALTGVAALGLACAATGSAPLRPLGWPLGVLALFLGFAAVATVANPYPAGALLGEYQRYHGLIPLCMYGLLLTVAALAVTDGERLRVLCWAVFAGGVVAAAAGAASLTGHEIGDWLVHTPTRAGGLYLQPNSLGVHLGAGAVIGLGLAATSRGRAAAIAAAGAGLQAAVLVATLSRGGWVGAGVALCLFAAIALRPTRRWLLPAAACVLVLAAFVLVVPGGRDALSTSRGRAIAGMDTANQSLRLGLWGMAVDMVRDEPVIGSGPDSFSIRFPAYHTATQPGIGERNVRPESSHNAILDQFVAFGLPGGVAFLALNGVAAAAGARAARGPNARHRPLVAAVVAAHAGYVTATFFGFAEAMTGWLPWLLMGAELGAFADTNRAPRPAARRRSRLRAAATRAPLATAGLLLIAGSACAFAGALATGHAATAASHGDTEATVAGLRLAGRLNPLAASDALALAAAYQSRYATTGDAADLDAAAATYHRANARFAPTAYSLLAEASILAARAAPGDADSARALATDALRLDPHNAPMRAAAAALMAQLP